MTSPIKPWEAAAVGRNLQSSASVQNVMSTPVGRMRVTPPVPPRPNSQGSGLGYNTGIISHKEMFIIFRCMTEI